jgi:hypothetical protein
MKYVNRRQQDIAFEMERLKKVKKKGFRWAAIGPVKHRSPKSGRIISIEGRLKQLGLEYANS